MQDTTSNGDNTATVTVASTNPPTDDEMDSIETEEKPASANQEQLQDFVEVVSRAQKRRKRKAASSDLISTPMSSSNKPPQPPARTHAMKPKALPKDDFTLVLKPHGCLRLGNIPHA